MLAAWQLQEWDRFYASATIVVCLHTIIFLPFTNVSLTWYSNEKIFIPSFFLEHTTHAHYVRENLSYSQHLQLGENAVQHRILCLQHSYAELTATSWKRTSACHAENKKGSRHAKKHSLAIRILYRALHRSKTFEPRPIHHTKTCYASKQGSTSVRDPFTSVTGTCHQSQDTIT